MKLVFCCFFALVCINVYAVSDVAAALEKPATPLLGITAVDDVFSDINEPEAHEGGAMGMQRFFSTKVISKLSTCTDDVHRVFSNWLAESELTPVDEIKSEHKLTILVWDKQRQGLFEAGYVLNIEQQYVRASLDYYSIDGQKVSPSSIKPLLDTYNLTALWNNISGALECTLQQ